MEKQDDLFDRTGIAAGLDGAKRALEHAEAVEPEWPEVAFDALVRVYQASPEVSMTIEQARQASGLDSPADQRAWGGVVQRMSRRKIIKRAGYAPAKSSNGSPKPLWVLT